MKKFSSIAIFAISMAAVIIGCGAKPVNNKEQSHTTTSADIGNAPVAEGNESTKFMQIVESGKNYDIWQDTRTGVEYFVCRSNSGNPAVTVMYYQNGEPFNDVQEAEEP